MRSLLLTIIIALFLFMGCSKTKPEQGKVVGVKTSFSLNEAVSGEIKNMYFEGALVLEKSNGEKVEALCDNSLIKNIKGGQMLEIEFDKELNSWKVVKIINESE